MPLKRCLILVAASIAAGVGLLGSQKVDALTYGSADILTARDCTGLAAQQNCAWFAPRTYFENQGGVNQTLSTNFTSSNGTYVANTAYGPGGMPVVRAGTWSSGTTRINSNVVAYQTFIYTGPSGVPFSLVGDLSFWTSGNDGLDNGNATCVPGAVIPTCAPAEGTGEGGIYSAMSFLSPDYVAGITSAAQIMGLLGYECGQTGVYAYADFQGIGLPSGSSSTTLRLNKDCAGNDIYLNTGDEFVLAVTLQTPSNRGGYSDATHTLIVNLDPELPPEALQILSESLESAPVPEPGTMALLGLGLAGLGFARRRRA